MTSVGPVQQETTQHEEQGHADVHPSEEAGQDLASSGTRDEPRVRQQDSESCERADALELSQVMGLLFRTRRRRQRVFDGGDGGGCAHFGTARTKGASVTHKPAWPSSGVILIAATRVCHGTW